VESVASCFKGGPVNIGWERRLNGADVFGEKSISYVAGLGVRSCDLVAGVLWEEALHKVLG